MTRAALPAATSTSWGGAASTWALILDTEAGIYDGAAVFKQSRNRVDLFGPRALVFRGGPQ